MPDLPLPAEIALPDHPRLRTGCCVFDHEGRLLLRSTRAAFGIEPEHREAMERVLSKLDGRHDIAVCLGGERAEDAFYALRMLAWFAETGLLQDGIARTDPASPPRAAMDGIGVAVAGQGALAEAMLRALRDLRATCVAVRGLEEVGTGLVAVLCSDSPDLRTLERADAEARRRSLCWFPVFGFGDAVVAGPLLGGGRPCFGCFALRWLGLSPAIALERACWAWFRDRQQPPDPALQAAAEPVARLAAAALAAAGSVEPTGLLIDLERVDAEPMPVLPHPCCPACSSTAAEPGASAWSDAALARPAMPLSALAQRLRPLRTGRAALAFVPPPRPERERIGPLCVAYARYADPAPATAGPVQNSWCQGSADRRDQAEAVATVEALERYAGLLPPRVDRRAAFAAISKQALDPRRLPLFSPAQYARPGWRFPPFDPEREQAWCRGYDLTRGEPILVPAEAASYGAESLLFAPTSSGVAAHSSRGEALLNAALELIERDALMIAWLHRLSPPLLDLETLAGESARALAQHVERRGYTLCVADLSTDLDIPVRLTLARREDRQGPALLVGAGAALDGAAATERALRELAAALATHTPLWTVPPALAPGEVKGLHDHSRAYEHPDWLPHASFLWASDRIAGPADGLRPRKGQTELQALTAHLASRGHALIGVDLTPPDVAASGVVVVRAIVPGLQPLDFGDALRLGGERLYDAPVRMGRHASRVDEDQLNPIPHCFP